MAQKSYTLELTHGEYRSLAWIADRYVSAEVLYDLPTWHADGPDTGGEGDPEVWRARLTSAHGWAYTGALIAHEDYDPGNVRRVPPCAGGALAAKIDAWLAEWEADHGEMADFELPGGRRP